MRIVTIGAGSIAWGPAINIDFLLHPALDGAELVLMDIDPAALELVRRLLERLIGERGLAKTVIATTDLETALRDADYVLTAISVGGDRLWRYDAIFPQIYGIFSRSVTRSGLAACFAPSATPVPCSTSAGRCFGSVGRALLSFSLPTR